MTTAVFLTWSVSEWLEPLCRTQDDLSTALCPGAQGTAGGRPCGSGQEPIRGQRAFCHVNTVPAGKTCYRGTYPVRPGGHHLRCRKSIVPSAETLESMFVTWAHRDGWESDVGEGHRWFTAYLGSLDWNSGQILGKGGRTNVSRYKNHFPRGSGCDVRSGHRGSVREKLTFGRWVQSCVQGGAGLELPRTASHLGAWRRVD